MFIIIIIIMNVATRLLNSVINSCQLQIVQIKSHVTHYKQ